MTEAEWLAATDPTPMISHLLTGFLGLKINKRSLKAMRGRKLRLFAVACLRRVEHLLSEPDGRSGIEVAERYADSQATRDEVLRAKEQADRTWRVHYRVSGIRFQTPKLGLLLSLSLSTTQPHLRHVAGNAACLTEEPNKPDPDEQSVQTRLLRDIFGNPFRPMSVDPRWLTADVLGLARGIYDERAFDRLPILADALMDAGCDAADLLAHCRSEGPHVRGCWVVDLILGKE